QGAALHGGRAGRLGIGAVGGKHGTTGDGHIAGVAERPGGGETAAILNRNASGRGVVREARQGIGAALVDDGGGWSIKDNGGRIRVDVGVVELEGSPDQISPARQRGTRKVAEAAAEVERAGLHINGAAVVEGDAAYVCR